MNNFCHSLIRNDHNIGICLHSCYRSDAVSSRLPSRRPAAVVAAPVIPLSGAAVHQHPAQQSYYMELAARLRRERYRLNTNTTTQQLHISPGNGTITVRGSVHPLDDTVTARSARLSTTPVCGCGWCVLGMTPMTLTLC